MIKAKSNCCVPKKIIKLEYTHFYTRRNILRRAMRAEAKTARDIRWKCIKISNKGYAIASSIVAVLNWIYPFWPYTRAAQ